MESEQRVMDEKGIGKWGALLVVKFDKGIDVLDFFIYC